MSDIKYFTIIGGLVFALSGCQSPSIIPQAETTNIPVQTASIQDQDLSKLVSEEIVVAAAMPISKDGQDDLIDRATDPLPLIPNHLHTLTEVTPPTADQSAMPETPADLWQVIRDGMKLDHHVDRKRVKAELNWYLRHPDYLNRVATRASRYMHNIVGEIADRDLPMELALLPVVESAFDPFAYSHGRASGLWQFIPSTGRLYGLKIDYWYDGRRDVVAATDAALRYLKASRNSLNDDWLLALAAYNTGEGNVRHSMRKNKKKNLPVDFFSLKLFRETSAYVPRLLAISELVLNPEKYGIKLKPIPNEPYFEAIDIGSQIDLTKAALLADISIKELYLLNPAFNKWSTHPEGPHRLLVPIDKAENFKIKLSQLPKTERISWQDHRVESGDNLGELARQYHTTIKTIRDINKLKDNLIVVGDRLMIPVASNSAADYQLSDSQRLKSNQAATQQKLGTGQKYRVKSGDSLWLIAKRFGVSTRSLAKWNGMAPTDLLRPGKQLTIFNADNSGQTMALASLSASAGPGSNSMIRKVNYRVRRGESLARIANKFNLSVNKIRKWNQKVSAKKYLQPGDRITLYVDITKAP